MSTISDQPLVKEVLLDATPARVWKALTDREELKQWSFEMDGFKPEEGFEFSFFGEKDGVKFKHLCKVIEVVKERKMKWLWSYEGVPGDTFVTFELFPEGNKTRLKLTHEGLEKLPQDENYAKRNFEAGWNELIGTLIKKHVEQA
jgi:uncharacterized protein YndB with AHSA1/START domain